MEINRDKTQVVNLREREKLRKRTVKPIPVLVGELNRRLEGWPNSFSIGYPTSVH